MVSPPTQFLSEKIGFKELVSITDMDFAYPNPAMAVPGDLIRKRPDLLDRFMRAYVRGMHRARTDREFTIKSLAKYTTVTDPVLLSKTYDFYLDKVVETSALHQHGRNAKCARRFSPNHPRGENGQAGTVCRSAFSRQTGKERVTQRALQIDDHWILEIESLYLSQVQR